uniref:L-ornithine 5-monooxygenase (L-ornithine N(5)-oxygenase) n=1 Tax=Ganoderma boninense TaxID=34458 RepID=A0A5K1JT19_9APHY|nr:L-ornithine 5-monooxygenase (L-ornithine N(5)-oxygenase) [Ganoderma boninense]
MTPNPLLISSNWLASCSSALRNADVVALTDLFLPNGWLRDILVFTWDIRCLEGRERITTYLADQLLDAGIEDVQFDNSPHLAARVDLGVEFAFTFECNRGHARAYVRLTPDADGVHRAFTMLTELTDLRGHEELGRLPLRDDVTGVPGRDMQKDYADMVADVEANPHVIIGARPSDLAGCPANCMRNYNFDISRRCTDSANQPFPSNWPEFTPRDKFADWLEHYASIQDLVVWTNSELKPRPTYNTEDRRWDVTIVRNGVEVKLRPAHIVLATGTLGRPLIPDILGMEGFQGRVLHSSRFPGGASFAGLRAVVVGAGNSSIDVCQDLALRGATSVTMVQRSASCVMSRDIAWAFLQTLYPDDVPLEVSDFKVASVGMGLRKRLAIEGQAQVWEASRELHEKLRRGGVDVNLGPEGEGIYPLVYDRLGGMDKGGADLIADGRIKVRSGVSVQRFTKTGLVLSDGTDLPETSSFLRMCTGFIHIRETNRELLGADIVDQTEEVYGLDDEGEIKGSYRPCGHPGLWFATGDVPASRYLSKALALQIKAMEIGLMPKDGRRHL